MWGRIFSSSPIIVAAVACALKTSQSFYSPKIKLAFCISKPTEFVFWENSCGQWLESKNTNEKAISSH
jgi:hypothetical protein